MTSLPKKDGVLWSRSILPVTYACPVSADWAPVSLSPLRLCLCSASFLAYCVPVSVSIRLSLPVSASWLLR